MADPHDATACSTSARGATGKALHSGMAVGIFLAVSILGAAADLVSKDVVFRGFLNDPALPEQVRLVMLPSDTTRQVIERLHQHGQLDRPIMPGLEFKLTTNPGTAFGSQWLPLWLVNMATVFTIAMVVWFFANTPRNARWTQTALGLIVGGAIGNLYDRLFARVSLPGADLPPITGQVRDFIDCSSVHVWGLNYPWIFNVADALLVVGVGILLIVWVFTGRSDKPAKKTNKAV